MYTTVRLKVPRRYFRTHVRITHNRKLSARPIVLLCIRKNRKRVALRPTQVFGILGRIHTDGHHSNRNEKRASSDRPIADEMPTYGELANGWENCELEPSNFRQSPEAVLIYFQ